jgi:hypothetical protein
MNPGAKRVRNFDKKVLEVAARVNKMRPLALGDAVIHKMTGLCGHVEAVETFGSTQGQMVSVRLISGKLLRGLRREEFGLHTAGPEQVRAQAPKETVLAVLHDTQEAWVSAKIEGTILGDSILDELC